MSLESIRRDIRNESITIGPHVVQRLWEDGLSIDQVLDTISNGIVRKREKDEYSEGQYTKYTIVKRHIAVVVKDCHPAFIITARRRK